MLADDVVETPVGGDDGLLLLNREGEGEAVGPPEAQRRASWRIGRGATWAAFNTSTVSAQQQQQTPLP